MSDRRGSRFVLEVLFLVGLAVALTLAKLDPLEIAGVMLLGWLIVAILEWAAWRGEPHYGSGLPPRYYVPNVNLPPAQPLEQVRVGYPEAHRDEAPTWIASAALRAEVLGEWPHTAPLPVECRPSRGRSRATPTTTAGRRSGSRPPRSTSRSPSRSRAGAGAAPAAPRRAGGADAAAVLARSEQGVARYSLDPLGDPPPRRRFGRGGTRGAAGGRRPGPSGGAAGAPGRANRQE